MKLNKSFLIFLILIAAFSCVTAQSASDREVKRLERAWLDAYEKHDLKAMEAIVADDFTITFPDGRIQTKPQILASLKQSRSSPPLRFYTEEVQSRIYGDTVILIGRVITEWQQKGVSMKEENRYTDTYVKRSGRWQVVASHLSYVLKPQSEKTKVSSSAGQERSTSKNTITSQKNPPIRIDVDERLQHIGILNFSLKNVAQVERYIKRTAGRLSF